MKKKVALLLLVLVFHLTITGCSAVNAVEIMDQAENKVEENLDIAEEKLEESLREKVVPPDKPQVSAPAPTVPADVLPDVTETAKTLTKEQALQIALDYLGFQSDQVTRLRTEYEIDDGIPQFDIEFHNGKWEYEFEIHAENGMIISFDKDND